jgi:hypothetical protein
MTIGASLFLIAIGAILRWAVADRIECVDLAVAGLIILIVGVAGLLVGLFLTFVRREPVGPAERYDRGPRY